MEVNLIVNTPQLASLIEKWTKTYQDITTILCFSRLHRFLKPFVLLCKSHVNTSAPAPGGIENVGLAMLVRSPGLPADDWPPMRASHRSYLRTNRGLYQPMT